jgi:hypothetical protein
MLQSLTDEVDGDPYQLDLLIMYHVFSPDRNYNSLTSCTLPVYIGRANLPTLINVR